MPPRSARLALVALLLGPAACGDDQPGNGGTTDGGDVDTAVLDVDGAPIDTPATTIDGGIDSTIDAPIDSPIDTPQPQLPRWGLTFPNEWVESIVTIGAKTYVLTWSGSATPLKLRTIVDRQVTATQTLVPGGGLLATDGQSLYVLIRFHGIQTIWGQEVGEPGATGLSVAKLDDALAARWQHVDSDFVMYAAGFDVSENGNAVLGVVRQSGNSIVSQLYVLTSATGQETGLKQLPHLSSVAINSTGRVFASGTLYNGEYLNGHFATGEESYLTKINGDSTTFTRFGAAGQRMIGLHDGDAILSGSDANGSHTLARHSGASGAALWTTNYEAAVLTTERIASAGTGAMYLFGTFPDRIDFSPTLRLETAGDTDLYVAEVDALTGVVRSAQQFGGNGHDEIDAIEHGTCPLIGGLLRGPLTHGEGVLSVPAAGDHRAFVATACPAAP